MLQHVQDWLCAYEHTDRHHIHMSHSEVSAAQSMLLSVVILLYLLTESMIYNYRMCVKTSTSEIPWDY